MKYLITGAGQIGTELTCQLTAAGHEVMILRRGTGAVPGARVVSGDAADAALVAELAVGAAAIFHTIHAAYDHRVWRRDLPGREQVVMDVAAQQGIPVVFPESVYAWGHGAEHQVEGASPQPCSPLGQVRAELLAARAAHRAITISIVAGDVYGPTASSGGSVARATIIDPVRAGRPAIVLANPGQPHSFTHLGDLAAAMIHAAGHADELAPAGDRVLHAPTADPVTATALATLVAQQAGRPAARVWGVPRWPVRVAGWFHPVLRELANQSYLWHRPAVLLPGVLTERGLRTTELAQGLAELPASGTIKG